MADYETLKTQRASVKGSLTRIKTHITNNQVTISAVELECRLGLLETYFSQIMSIQDDMDKVATKPAEEEAKRGQLEEQYVETKSAILTLLNQKQAAANCSEIHNSTTIAHPISSGTKLPKLKLPKFSGKYTEYPNFIQQFRSLVDSDGTMSNIDKFTHLVEDCLIGDAKLAIKSLDVTADNYPKALQMLKDRYDNKCIIFQSHIRELFDLQSISKPIASQLRNLSDQINGHIRALRSLGNDADIVNAFLVHIASIKIDETTFHRWDDKRSLEDLPTWDDFSDFLNKRCQTLENREMVSVKVQPASTSALAKLKSSRRSYTSLSISSKKCDYCKGADHVIYKCSTFINLKVEDRYRAAKILGLCLNCLHVGHGLKDCPSNSKCRICSMKHHSLLHKYTATGTSDSGTSSHSDSTSSAAAVVHC